MDVSNNRRVNQYPESNAEYLASLLPDSVVVKGFNVISAWTLQQSCLQDSSTQVHHGKIDTFRAIYSLCFEGSFPPSHQRSVPCHVLPAEGVQRTKRRIGSSIVIKKEGILS